MHSRFSSNSEANSSEIVGELGEYVLYTIYKVMSAIKSYDGRERVQMYSSFFELMFQNLLIKILLFHFMVHDDNLYAYSNGIVLRFFRKSEDNI